MARRRLGLLGPIIVIAGAAVAGVAAWYVVHAKPKVGDVIDEVPLDSGKIIVRGERGGDRAFLELYDRDQLKWQALVPHYIGARGRSAIAWSADAITIRVQRQARAEVFAFARATAAKIGGFRLAPEHEPNKTPPDGPLTLTDHVRSYEFVGGSTWHQVIAIDLRVGQGVWRAELGPAPVRAAGIDRDRLWIEQSTGKRWLDVASGREAPDKPL